MSYILDALRRADAERDRGSVPDLRAQPLGVPSAQEASRPLPWPWIGAVLALVLLGALAWYLAAPDEPQPAATPAAAPAPPQGTGTAATAMPRTTTGDAAAAVQKQPSAAPPATEPRKPSVTVVATAPPRAASTPASASTRAEPPSAADRVVAQADLPPDIRRQLPPLVIGGSMYSENAANRMLIVNGQLLHEHEKAAPEVTLEQIRLKSAVLSFRGHRFEIGY
jgi:general secretion pathway protein B